MTTYYGTVTAKGTGTTDAGTAFERWELSFGSDAALALVPSTVVPGSPVTLVIYAHGFGGSSRGLDNAGTTRDGMLARGWVIVAGDNGGFLWGNGTAMDLIRSQRAWADEHWAVQRTILWGGSMGGLTVLNALGRDVIHDVAATIAYISVVDSSSMDEATYGPSIKAAYGASSMAEVSAKAAGYDPARDDPQKWANKPIFLNQGTTDTIVVKALHGDVFMARAATPEKIAYDVSEHGHGGGGAVVENRALAWVDQYAPAYVAPSTDPGPPPPSDGDTPAPAAPSGSGVYWADGREVSLYRADGSLVRLSRS